MFYGWKLSLLSMSGNLMLQGSVLYAMNAFMDPLCAANGWTRAEVNFSMGLASLMGQMAMPLAASLAARCSLRRLMSLGALTGGLCTILMGYTADIRLYTLLSIVVWAATQICGGVVGNALMSNWFCRYRGRAFGLANAGTSLSGVVLPFLVLLLIDSFGVSAAYTTLGLATCALAPLSWFMVRDTPAVMHLNPDGGANPARVFTQQNGGAPKPLWRAPKAYCLGAAFGVALMTGSAIMSQMKPRFADLGLDAYTAMSLACVAALFAALAKYAWGWICDRLTPLTAARLVMACSALSLSMAFLPPALWSMALFSASFGACIGGLWTVLPAVVSYYYGNGNFLPCYKFISIFIVLRSAGFPVMGFSHEFTGSYAAADSFFVVLLLVALGLTFVLREKEAAEYKSPCAPEE